MTTLGKLRNLSDIDAGSSFSRWRMARGLPYCWALVQTDYEVWSILESIGTDKDAYRYLLVAAGDGEYKEIWGTNSFRLDGVAEQLFWMGKVTA